MVADRVLQEVQAILRCLTDMPCWHVSAGKGTGSSFSLALGKKIPREHALKNVLQAEEFQKCEGEANLLVWCTWRLDSQLEAVTSSDEADEIISKKLDVLVGNRIILMEVVPPAWDMHVSFSNDLHLVIFCDHVPGDPSFDGNWQLRVQKHRVYAGPGYRLHSESRSGLRASGDPA